MFPSMFKPLFWYGLATLCSVAVGFWLLSYFGKADAVPYAAGLMVGLACAGFGFEFEKRRNKG